MGHRGPLVESVKTTCGKDVLALWRVIQRMNVDQAVVEDFVGSGPRTKDAIHTMKVLGFFLYRCEEACIKVVVAQPSARLNAVSFASRFTGQRDEVSALAHVISYLRRSEL